MQEFAQRDQEFTGLFEAIILVSFGFVVIFVAQGFQIVAMRTKLEASGKMLRAHPGSGGLMPDDVKIRARGEGRRDQDAVCAPVEMTDAAFLPGFPRHLGFTACTQRADVQTT